MATSADVLAQAAVAVEAEVAGVVRLASDYRDDLEPIPADVTRYQLRGGPAGTDSDSNATATTAELEVELHHRVATGAERDWTEGDLQDHLEAMIRPAFWRSLAAVLEVIEPPSYAVSVDLRVVSARVRVAVSIVP